MESSINSLAKTNNWQYLSVLLWKTTRDHQQRLGPAQNAPPGQATGKDSQQATTSFQDMAPAGLAES